MCLNIYRQKERESKMYRERLFCKVRVLVMRMKKEKEKIDLTGGGFRGYLYAETVRFLGPEPQERNNGAICPHMGTLRVRRLDP